MACGTEQIDSGKRSKKKHKKITKLNPIDRSTIYKMVDGLLQKEEYRD